MSGPRQFRQARKKRAIDAGDLPAHLRMQVEGKAAKQPSKRSSERSAAEACLERDLRALKLPAAVTEYRFHGERKWRFDFAWPDRKLACEVEGGIYTKGRHTRPAGYTNDCEKYDEAQLLGWLVLRVTPDMVGDGRAIAFIERGLAVRPPSQFALQGAK